MQSPQERSISTKRRSKAFLFSTASLSTAIRGFHRAEDRAELLSQYFTEGFRPSKPQEICVTRQGAGFPGFTSSGRDGLGL